MKKRKIVNAMYLFIMRCQRRISAFRERFLQANIFKSGSDDPELVAVERWSSRIYFILFVAVVGLLAIYTAVQKEQTLVKIDHPSVPVFESLYKRYPYTLRCPCLKTNIRQSKFIGGRWRLHQVCQCKK